MGKRLAKVDLGCPLKAIDVVAHENTVDVSLEDFFFGEMEFHAVGFNDFDEL